MYEEGLINEGEFRARFIDKLKEVLWDTWQAKNLTD